MGIEDGEFSLVSTVGAPSKLGAIRSFFAPPPLERIEHFGFVLPVMQL
jgi:hypothetical protein